MELTSNRTSRTAPQPTLCQPPAPLFVECLSKDEAVGGEVEEKEEVNEGALSGEGSEGLHWGVLGRERYGRDEGEVGKARGDRGIIPKSTSLRTPGPENEVKILLGLWCCIRNG